MYLISKREHNDSTARVFGLADTMDAIPGIIRKWMKANNNHDTIDWHIGNVPFATVKFHPGVEVKFNVQVVEVLS